MPILPEHKEILLTQSESKTLPEWHDYFGIYTKSQIYSFCHRNNKIIKKLSKQEVSQKQSKNARKYRINENYFKTWTSNMAYMLGFWFADGCIYRERMFDITVHSKDKYILKKFAEELEYEGNIQDYVDRQAYRLNFSCITIYNDIIALGGKECKSTDITFPKIPKQYLSDFIRGYFDGDGCAMRIKGGRLNTAFTCGSENFINSLWKVLKEEAGIEGGSYDKSCYTLKFGNKDSIKIGEYIYKNNPELFLQRKYNKFIS